MADERRCNELGEFERGLAGLIPQVDGVDRDELLFLAGQRSVTKRRCWLWPTMTALSTLAAGVLAVVLWIRGSVDQDGPLQPAQATVPRDESAPMARDQRTDEGARLRLVAEDSLAPSYFRLRRMALASGIDAMPGLVAQPTSPVEATPPPRVIESRHYKFR